MYIVTNPPINQEFALQVLMKAVLINSMKISIGNIVVNIISSWAQHPQPIQLVKLHLIIRVKNKNRLVTLSGSDFSCSFPNINTEENNSSIHKRKYKIN